MQIKRIKRASLGFRFGLTNRVGPGSGGRYIGPAAPRSSSPVSIEKHHQIHYTINLDVVLLFMIFNEFDFMFLSMYY